MGGRDGWGLMVPSGHVGQQDILPYNPTNPYNPNNPSDPNNQSKPNNPNNPNNPNRQLGLKEISEVSIHFVHVNPQTASLEPRVHDHTSLL